MATTTSWIVRLTPAIVSMAIAANCFLKYLWWAACYSAWAGIPRLTEQWRRAGSRASFFGWSVIVLELFSVAAIFSLIHQRAAGLSRNALRLVFSLVITIAGTALFAGALTWIKQISN